ncbi:MAG: type II toxin-antitoxin system PemK/MazF family toxin [Pyrinomonadaceae bacterium]
MKTGEIVLIPFPFADFSQRKVRPAAVVCETRDAYRDIVLCAISSVIPDQLSENELVLKTDDKNGLRKDSVLKIDRIVTAKRQDVIANIGKVNSADLTEFKGKFKHLIEEK